MAKFTKLLSPRLFGVDLGSEQIRVYDLATDSYQSYPSLIAFYQQDHKIAGVGQDAYDLMGRAEERIVVERVIAEGQIRNFDLAYSLLKIILQPIFKTSFLSPDVMVSCPHQSSKAQQQALVSLFTHLGCAKVYLISESLASAIGAGVPIADASGSALIHLGADLVQGTVVSLGTNLAKVSGYQAGNYANQLLQSQVLDKHNLILSAKTANLAKNQVGLLGLETQQRAYLLAGKNNLDQSPTEIEVSLDFITQAILPVGEAITDLLRHLLSQIPPDLTVDVIDKGILLSGGLAQLVGLPQYLSKHLGVSCSVVDQPEITVIRGIANALEHLDEFKQSLGYSQVE